MLFFSLIPYGEEDTFEVICDGEWLAIGYSSCNDGEEQVYYSYNPSYADTEELSPLESGGQSPVEKYLAINDIEAGVKAAEYFIKFQPENPWSLDRGMNGITPGKATLKILYFNNIYDTILTCKHIISVL